MPSGVGHRATIGHITRAATRDVGQRAMKTGIIRIKYNKTYYVNSGAAVNAAVNPRLQPWDSARRSAIPPGPPRAMCGQRATIGHTTRAATRDVWTARDDRPYHPGRHARRVVYRAMKTGIIRIKYNKNTLR